MPRRSLLSTEQRTRLFAIPIDPADMARHYVPNTQDLTVIRAKRRTVNRLGFAIQLSLLRYPGQGLGPDEHPPEAMIVFVAHQLGVSPATFADYALRDQTRREHAVGLQQHLRLRNFGLADWRACLQVDTNAASATDRGEPIVQAMLDRLRAANVLLPAAAVLERIGLAARVRARRKAFEALADGVTDAERAALETLLTVDPDRWAHTSPTGPKHHTAAGAVDPPQALWKTRGLTSMLSRGSTLAGAVGSSKAECAVRRRRGNVLTSPINWNYRKTAFGLKQFDLEPFSLQIDPSRVRSGRQVAGRSPKLT